MASPAATATSPAEQSALLLIRRVDAPFAAALHQCFRVLDFFASGLSSLPAFLAAATAIHEPPRAAVIMGGGLARVDADFLDALPSLRCIVSMAANHIDLHECVRRGVAVANSGTVYSADTADHAVCMLIDVLRRVTVSERFVHRGVWPLQVQGYYCLGFKLGGRRVGIIGSENIGSLIAKRLEAFGCVIYYHSRKPKDLVSYMYFSEVHDLASESDVLVVACALNKETCHIVNKDVLDALGKDGVIINIGRGANVDEAEMVRALNEGRIAGAGLDVFEDEPRVPPKLFAMDNVVLTAA